MYKGLFEDAVVYSPYNNIYTINHKLGGRKSYRAESVRQAIDMYAKDVLPTIKPIGVYSLGYVGVEVIGIEYGSDDYVFWRWSDEPMQIHKAKIYYYDEEMYFRAKSRNVKFSEILKV